MKKIKKIDFNFFKKVFKKNFSSKLITTENIIDIKKEMINFKFFKKKKIIMFS